MEDVEFFRRLRRCGRVVYSNKRIGASPRRYETVGPARLTFAFGSIAALYLLGVSLSTLARHLPAACVVSRSAGFPAVIFKKTAAQAVAPWFCLPEISRLLH